MGRVGHLDETSSIQLRKLDPMLEWCNQARKITRENNNENKKLCERVQQPNLCSDIDNTPRGRAIENGRSEMKAMKRILKLEITF